MWLVIWFDSIDVIGYLIWFDSIDVVGPSFQIGFCLSMWRPPSNLFVIVGTSSYYKFALAKSIGYLLDTMDNELWLLQMSLIVFVSSCSNLKL